MAARRNNSPFAPLLPGNEYAIEWEAVTDGEDATPAARDALGLTATDRAALGLSPVNRRDADAPPLADDARGMLSRMLQP